jgi:NTE family protein
MKHSVVIAGLVASLLLAGTVSAADCQPSPDVPPVVPVSAHGMRVGVAFGSGSMHGLAHVGVIQALEASGLEVRVVSGTSAGAIVGSLWASGLDSVEIERLATQLDWDAMGRLAPSSEGLLTGVPMREELARRFDGRPIEAWPRRFGAVATNMATGQRRVLMSGDGARAVQASSAIPVLYRPVTIGREKLADGALVEPVPVQAARDLGADYVIAVDVAYRPYEEPARGLSGQAFQAMHILTNRLAERELADADFALKLDVHHAFMACGRAGLVLAGREAMQRSLPALEASLARAAARPARAKRTR